MKYITFVETTGENLQQDVTWAWSKFVNKGISQINSVIAPIHSPVKWNTGNCFECDYPVSKTATGCPNCHITFID